MSLESHPSLSYWAVTDGHLPGLLLSRGTWKAYDAFYALSVQVLSLDTTKTQDEENRISIQT